MLRQGLLWLSQQNGIFRFVRSNPMARRFASRFVAGETIEEGVASARELMSRGITASLDLLGESVSKPAEATTAKDQYLVMLDRMAAAGNIEVNVSVKLTQMGLDIDEGLCRRNMREILERAAAHRGFVRLDMEGSDYTQRTLDFFRQHLFPDFSAHCGVVIQSALRRSERDINDMIAMRARVRLCKGAYLEPPDVAFPEKADVDRNYVKLMERLLTEGNYPGLATHDEKIISHARAFVGEQRIADDRFEFQMLYGVRRDLQQQLRAAGHRMRVYIPFGTQWYPYLMRRLAERPANIAFMMGNIVKESVKHR
ncbi:MAG TPA: proline dehydrogenase family protein [Gemmatimonadales bacterium]|jgi:proline dehydrogenase|nr:proline dehydrogenase family protein [Gemmatimonadales bacterium]